MPVPDQVGLCPAATHSSSELSKQVVFCYPSMFHHVSCDCATWFQARLSCYVNVKEAVHGYRIGQLDGVRQACTTGNRAGPSPREIMPWPVSAGTPGFFPCCNLVGSQRLFKNVALCVLLVTG